MKTLLALAAMFSLVVSQTVWAQAGVKIKAEPLTEAIYMITGKGGNMGLLTGEDGSFLIDDQFAPLTEQILEVVKSVGGDVPRFLINTHFHADHTGGNENLGNAGTLLMSHHGVRERLAAGSYIEAFGMKSAPASETALPSITYSENMHVHINGETIQVIHTPNAHTDGDSFIVFSDANIIHTGDIFFNGFFPFIDGANGGSVKGMVAACDAILAVSDEKTRIIPGHGPLAGKAELQDYRDMLATVHERLSAFKNQGLDADAVVAKGPLRDLERKWGGGIFKADKWIRVIYPAAF